MRSTALVGSGWPTIPMLPVWSMTTSANEPARSLCVCVCQKGTVIEQSEVSLLHSVIHSSDLNVCSPAADAKTKNWAKRPRNGSSTFRKCPICISGVSPTQSLRDGEDFGSCSARLVWRHPRNRCHHRRDHTGIAGASRYSSRLLCTGADVTNLVNH